MHDQKCYDLAKAFLDEQKRSTEEDRKKLADWIQETIEDFIAINYDVPE